MANHAPDRAGLIRYYNIRKVEADVAVHRAIDRLSRRRDVPPSRALSVLVDAVRSSGISKRTLQRHWQAAIAAFRETLRERYLRPVDRRRVRMLNALAKTKNLAAINTVEHDSAHSSPGQNRTKKRPHRHESALEP